MHDYELDEYDMVLPSEQTAKAVAEDLRHNQSPLLSLGLGEGTMMNILFALPRVGVPSNAYRLEQIVVAIDRTSMYQFYADKRNGGIDPNYVVEKMKVPMEDAKVLAKFIEMIRENL